MYPIPVGFAPIPDPVSFSSAFVSDMSLGFAAWLAIAAVVYLAILPVAFRRSERTRIETVRGDVALRQAA